MSASEQFIQAIQTGDLLYVERHLKRPVSDAFVVLAEEMWRGGCTPRLKQPPRCGYCSPVGVVCFDKT